MLTLKQLEDTFRDLTCNLLGLDPNDPTNGDKVRIAWPTGGAPAWKITDDVVFLRISSANSDYSVQRDTEYTDNAPDLNEVKSYTLPRQVSWVLYGPNSFEKAEIIRDGLFKSGSTLAALNLYLVINVPVPVRSPELFNGRWWERSDFSAMFYEKVTNQTTIPTIQTVNIQIKTEEGVTENANPIT